MMLKEGKVDKTEANTAEKAQVILSQHKGCDAALLAE